VSKTFQKKTRFLPVFFLVLFLKSSAVQLKFPVVANCVPFIGTVTSLGTALVVSVDVNKKKKSSQDSPHWEASKGRASQGSGPQSDLKIIEIELKRT